MKQETTKLEPLFQYVESYVETAIGDGEDTPDGAYWAIHEEAVASFFDDGAVEDNPEIPFCDWFDVQLEYLTWKEMQSG